MTIVQGFNVGGFREDPDSDSHHSFEALLQGRMVAGTSGDRNLREFTSPRHNQRRSSSCVAQSAVKAIEIKRIMKYGHDAHVDLSRLAVYWMARNLMSPPETTVDSGTYIGNAFDAMRRWGVPPEAAWPFDMDKIFDGPDWMAMRKAYLGKITAFYRIGSTGQNRVDAVAQAIQAGNPVVYGTNVDSTWFGYKKGTVLQPVSKADRAGRHATTLIGIVDGKFVGENSWGKNWGDDGFYLADPSVISDSDAKSFWVALAGWEPFAEQD